MKRRITLLLAAILAMSLAACGQNESGGNRETIQEEMPEESQSETSDIPEVEMEIITENIPSDSETAGIEEGSRILLAYFSVPENVETTDAVAGASIVIKDGEKVGNTEYVAGLVQQTIGGDLFRIEAGEEYPLDHDPLVDQAADEQSEHKRPELKYHVENMEQYDTIILGYPNWWADLPMPVYTFLEEYNLEGKTIIPFVTHGGSGFSGTVGTISELQPGAYVSENTLSLSRNEVAGSADKVMEWAESLGLNTEVSRQ